MKSTKAKRKAPSADVLRRLYAVSGNVCDFPGCKHPVFNVDGKYVAQLCHIEAAEEDGERFNPDSSDAERASFENLMFMCYEHHTVTNDVMKYTVAVLRTMKKHHEDRFSDARLFDQVRHQFINYTALINPKRGATYKRFRQFAGFSESDDLSDYIDGYAERLSKVDRPQRELLCIIADLMKDGPVTHDELAMATRKSREEVATQIGLLEKHKLAWFEYDEHTKNADILVDSNYTDPSPLVQIRDYAAAEGESLRAILVDLGFDLLD